MTQTLLQVQRSLDVVEAHLFGALPLAALAATADYSAWRGHHSFGDGEVDNYVPVADG